MRHFLLFYFLNISKGLKFAASNSDCNINKKIKFFCLNKLENYLDIFLIVNMKAYKGTGI